MSKTSPEVTPDTHLQEPAAPVVEDSKIPEQIKKMDHESIAIYLNALESGSERRRDINLIIVGKKSVGKTSLVRRLFGEELQSVKSTNGIEIHRRRCRINLSNWEWNKVLDTRLVKETSINNRMLQSIVKELHQDKEKPKHDILEISSSDQISTDDNKGTITKNIEHDEEPQPKHAKMNYQFAYPEITESPLSKLAKDELLSIIGSAVDLQDEDGYANLTVWDFAGDIEYYNTHQTFLNSEAIFLVVANLHDIDDTVSYGTFNFWMDTIHCYGSINDKTEAVLLEGAHNLLDPPVIAIGTHKDKFQDEEQCRKRLESYTDKIFKDSKLHLRSIHLISNTEDEEDAFEKLRNDIFATAKSTANWNREYPVKFIQMEKAINSELTIGKQIISFERLKELGEKIPLPITDNKELHLFLRYQHEIGNVIFFEDISSYIILDPQWLANAFKCIVTAQQFQFELPHLQWDNFKKTGKMDPKLLEEIFKKQSADMRIHKEHILEVIEKFDIIIYPLLLTESGNVQREHSFFYVPCMLQTLKIKDIDVLFNVPNASKSTCLCFVFSFLPPYLISNLIVSCLREYPLAVVKGEIGLFKDCCVFNIGRTGCAKFVLAKSSHMIQLQVWQWNEVDTEVNQAVLKVVEREINRIVNTRYKLKTVSFEKKWKCETTSFSFDTGFLEFDQVNDGENYYCEEHATVHKYKDYWSGEKSKASRRISSDQQNYVRMSMIVLEVLSGVLYDRLYIDTKTGEILDRDKLDITEMCKKYCALKINFPSKGFRKIEKVDEISTNEDTIGDDIQRIRVIRNEMQHSSVFALDDTRYQTLITIVHDMLTRFDQRNNPAGESYVKRLDEIRKMELETRSFEEIKERMKAGLIEKMHAVFDSMVSDALNDIC
ncbi:unnamed protein product [Mytilus edulis]|uniref:non-specific serine/threonine protein kinase n=1 Tax=Mytilus edulis TaxID=6550 RepID=A0A8S3SWJ3_MYTED|nr:unnamed protein product [Mytilus edulis]